MRERGYLLMTKTWADTKPQQFPDDNDYRDYSDLTNQELNLLALYYDGMNYGFSTSHKMKVGELRRYIGILNKVLVKREKFSPTAKKFCKELAQKVELSYRSK